MPSRGKFRFASLSSLVPGMIEIGDGLLDSINADYLVIGAGATGPAFTDALIADSDVTPVLAAVTRRAG